MALTLVKCGGAALAKEPFVLGRYVEAGARACVVHGAGTRISAALTAAGLESTFVGGRRVTTAEALPLVREAMRAENDAICEQIGERAHGLMGGEIGLEAEHVPELGRVGMPLPVVPDALRALLGSD